MFYHPCQTILSHSDRYHFWKIGRLASEEVILELVKTNVYHVCCMDGMLYFTKKFFEIVRLCCRTIPNETLKL